MRRIVYWFSKQRELVRLSLALQAALDEATRDRDAWKDRYEIREREIATERAAFKAALRLTSRCNGGSKRVPVAHA